MPRIFGSRNRIVYIVIIVLFILFLLVAVAWYFYFVIGLPSFSKDTAVTIHDSIIQGISGLGSVAIAVIIFRIQSLENRNESLEQTTLNYISQTLGWSYPEWTASLEEDIKNKTITNRYFSHVPSATGEFVAAEKDRHQKRLEEALELHNRTQQTIRRIRSYVFSCVFFLIVPILLSLLLLMVANLLDLFWNFTFLSAVILMCALGILLLIQMVVESTVTES